MKKIIFTFHFFSAGIMISNAQIWIGPWDVPVAGKVLQRANDTMKTKTPGSINPGSAGANQTWNFSTLLSNTVDTLTFTNPAWTANGSSFPNSNLAVMNSKTPRCPILKINQQGFLWMELMPISLDKDLSLLNLMLQKNLILSTTHTTAHFKILR